MPTPERCRCGEDLRVGHGGHVFCAHCDRHIHDYVPAEVCPRCKEMAKR